MLDIFSCFSSFPFFLEKLSISIIYNELKDLTEKCDKGFHTRIEYVVTANRVKFVCDSFYLFWK